MSLTKEEVAEVVALADKNYEAGRRHGLELAQDICRALMDSGDWNPSMRKKLHDDAIHDAIMAIGKELIEFYGD
jgi:hypothetical protein